QFCNVEFFVSLLGEHRILISLLQVVLVCYQLKSLLSKPVAASGVTDNSAPSADARHRAVMNCIQHRACPADQYYSFTSLERSVNSGHSVCLNRDLPEF